MSTQTLYQGSLRPIRPAITVVHPGLQVHSIAAPKTERRLSFLMSANLYCAFAAGAVLVAQAAPSFNPTIIKTDRDRMIVELRPFEPTPQPLAVRTPILPDNVPSNPAVAPTLNEPQPIDDITITPTTTGTIDMSGHSASNPPPTTGGGHGPVSTTPPGTGPFYPPPGQPIELSSGAVSVLHQIQPIYPSLARLAHKEGDVVLIMTINELGVPTEVKMDSGDTIFRNDAIRAAQQWRFTAAQLDGRPHAARFRLTLQFRLRG
jgi:protein TonB